MNPVIPRRDNTVDVTTPILWTGHPTGALVGQRIRKPIDWGDLACLIAPALSFIRVNIGGQVFATDVCLLLLLPIVARRINRGQERLLGTFALMSLSWLLAQVGTDVIRGTASADYMRGWVKIGLTLTHFLTIALLIRQSERRLLYYAWGTAIGGILTFVLAPTEHGAGQPWKFGVGAPITLMGVIVSAKCITRYRNAAITMLASLTAINLVLGYRSQGAVCAVATVYTWGSTAGMRKQAMGKAKKLVIAAAICLAAWGVSSAYGFCVERGWFGEEATFKYQAESGGEAGILLGGRSELLGAWAAIVDSPVLGHGSWARDPKYGGVMAQRRNELGYSRLTGSLAGPDADLIPSHSHVFGAWVEAGVVGAVFWCWILISVVKPVIRASGREPMMPFFIYVAASLTWHILFSPYGAEGRFTTMYFVYAMNVLAMYTAAQRKKSHVYSFNRHHLL